MPLDKNKLGWIPDYPDFRDLKMADINKIIKEQSPTQNQEDAASQILELAKLIKKIVSPEKDTANQESLKIIDQLIKRNENKIKFLRVKVENKAHLYRGIRHNKIIDIQDRLKFIFKQGVIRECLKKIDIKMTENEKNKSKQEQTESEKIKEKHLTYLLENLKGENNFLNDELAGLDCERGYFGEATNSLLIFFKKMWELPSQNSIVDFNPNYDAKTKKEEEEDFYEYNPENSIYTVVNTIYKRIQHKNPVNSQEEFFKTDDYGNEVKLLKEDPEKKYLKIGDYGDEVKLLKEKLEKLDYFQFSKDDNYEYSKYFFGYKTDLVVEFFQGINGLNADGIVGKDTTTILESDNPPLITQDNKQQDNNRMLYNSIIYIQKKLYKFFGYKNVKINGKWDDLTIERINELIKREDERSGKNTPSIDINDKNIKVEHLNNILRNIIYQAEESKQYFLYQPLIFPEYNQLLEDNKLQKDSPQKILLTIQQPIPQNIITIFQNKLKIENCQSEKSSDKIYPVIYPFIQLVIKNFSDIGIHGQLDYEQAITQAIDLINIVLASNSDTKASDSDEKGKNEEKPGSQKQFFDNDENMTQLLLEFVRGRRERDREINLMLIYQSLSAEERKRLNFLLWISLDQIESMIGEIEEFCPRVENQAPSEREKVTPYKYKTLIPGLKRKLIDKNKSDKNSSIFSIANKNDNNNQTVLQTCPVSESLSKSEQSSNQHELLVPCMSELENQINLPSQTPVYLCLPEFVDLSYWCSPIKNQESLNSCTACAAIDLVEYFQNRTRDEYTNASVLFLYKVARKLMHREGDVGASIRETMKAMVLFGIPPEEYWPYEPSKIDEEPSGFCYSYAQNYQAIQYFRLDTPGLPVSYLLAQIKMTLVAGLPSIFGLTIYSSIYEKTNYRRGHIPTPKPKDNVQGGHAVVAVGYDDSKIIGDSVGALLIRNSWGTNWGERGYGWLPYDYILKGLTSDWWSLIKAEWFETKNFGLGADDWKYDSGIDNGDPTKKDPPPVKKTPGS
ncbi:C1 family peptidase [Planktothrix sp. FACHB-1365]|uniref:C1 family peptidase n=1 Tax=Planktothrix sp. FACHB-1365 TaxID=2692855 RepID=UPI00168417BC|nr:C1 family peptidase [Planktothrix sp. FACHB-1365]MBD2483420.1 peptidoglycan-binding protein [Planktothrix sp. FACHB-1365]